MENTAFWGLRANLNSDHPGLFWPLLVGRYDCVRSSRLQSAAAHGTVTSGEMGRWREQRANLTRGLDGPTNNAGPESRDNVAPQGGDGPGPTGGFRGRPSDR